MVSDAGNTAGPNRYKTGDGRPPQNNRCAIISQSTQLTPQIQAKFWWPVEKLATCSECLLNIVRSCVNTVRVCLNNVRVKSQAQNQAFCAVPAAAAVGRPARRD
jgi:hypothetical protein